MTEKPDVIMVGLDGATWDWIKPWAEEGKLPAFKKMMKGGAWGESESTIPPISPTAWASIFTGLTPEKHSIWSFVKQKAGSYYIRPISSKDIKGKVLWRILSENKVRSIFINIPFSYPPSEFNGIITSGLGTPSKSSNFAYPQSVKETILSKFPNYNVDFNEDRILTRNDRSFIINEIYRITEAHINVFKHFYKQEKDTAKVFSVVLRSLDVIQHYFWNAKEIIFKFYRQADRFLNWCIKNKEEIDILLVCSDHGFRKVHKRIYLNEWLKKKGFLKEKTSKNPLHRKILPSAELMHKLLINLGLQKLIWKIKRSKCLERLIEVFPSETLSYIERINWEHTKAYAIGSLGGMTNLVQVNLKDREPRGAVFEKRYDEVREKIIKGFSSLKSPESGEETFEFIKKGEEVYGHLGKYPDIVSYPKDGYTLFGGFSKSGQIFEDENDRSGDHAMEGIILAYGKPINNTLMKGTKIWDIPPIILRLLNLSIPSCFDGRVPNGLFRSL